MNLQQYNEQKEQQHQAQMKIPMRNLCADCWQPDFNCFCHEVDKFDPQIEFVILIHPLESKRRIATGRMAYLGLENAHIVRGTEFASNPTVNRLLSDDRYQNVILSPGLNSIDLSTSSEEEKREHFSGDKKLRVFVIDGTWSNAGTMISKTPRLKQLPRFCFTPKTPSKIRVRKQPNPNCYSTLEAIHHIIELLGKSQGLNMEGRIHDKLLKPFQWMVNQQIERLKKKRKWRFISHRK